MNQSEPIVWDVKWRRRETNIVECRWKGNSGLIVWLQYVPKYSTTSSCTCGYLNDLWCMCRERRKITVKTSISWLMTCIWIHWAASAVLIKTYPQNVLWMTYLVKSLAGHDKTLTLFVARNCCTTRAAWGLASSCWNKILGLRCKKCNTTGRVMRSM